jgi:DivIVA domain-containing protein
MTARYRALLIGNSAYPADPHNLQRLQGPVNDVALLHGALLDPRHGMFPPGSVALRPECDSREVLGALDEFYGQASKDDVLLLYFSGHGRLDENNVLYLCARDTRTDKLRSTAVSSRVVNEFVDASPATKTVIILDCCHSGAFKGADIGRALSGPKRYVLSSCRSNELANDASVANHASMFTEQVVAGMLHAPIRPGAGHLTIEELYEYARDGLIRQGRQLPLLRTDGDGGLPIARRGGADPRPAMDPNHARPLSYPTFARPAPDSTAARPVVVDPTSAGPSLLVSETLLDLGTVEPDEVLPTERVYVTARRPDGGPARWSASAVATWVWVRPLTGPDRVEITVTPPAGATRANIEIRNDDTGEVRTVRVVLRSAPSRVPEATVLFSRPVPEATRVFPRPQPRRDGSELRAFDELIAKIETCQFRKPPIGKRGYDEYEVDTFLDHCVEELRAKRVVEPTKVHNVAFAKPPFGKRGYDEEEVDVFLHEVEEAMHRLTGGS